MSNPEENPAIEPNAGPVPTQPVTVVPSHEGEGAMGLRSMTVVRYEEIRCSPGPGEINEELSDAVNIGARGSVLLEE